MFHFLDPEQPQRALFAVASRTKGEQPVLSRRCTTSFCCMCRQGHCKMGQAFLSAKALYLSPKDI